MKNPCLECEHLGDNKNDPVCTQCDRRIEYVQGLGGINDMQPLLGLNGGGSSPSVGADYDAGKEGIEEMGDTKVCSKADCEHKGEPQSLDDFDKNKTMSDGRASYCKDCRRRSQRDKKNSDKRRKYTKKIDPPEIEQGPPIPASIPYIITIDLSESPELYHKLAEREAIDIIMNALR